MIVAADISDEEDHQLPSDHSSSLMVDIKSPFSWYHDMVSRTDKD